MVRAQRRAGASKAGIAPCQDGGTQANSNGVAVAPARQGRHILLVDDDRILSELLGLRLQIEGYRTTRAGDGADAIRLFKAVSPDLIILDLMMPVMDGVGFLQWAHADETVATPIIVLSAAVRADNEVELKAAGAAEALGKPVEFARLLEKIESTLGLQA
jgi:DNA-binding response OmpR family regulator